MHMLFRSRSVHCFFLSFNTFSSLDSVFFIYLLFLWNDWVCWRLTNIYCVRHLETRGLLMFRCQRLFRSVRYVAYVMNSQTWKLHSILLHVKNRGHTRYNMKEKGLISQILLSIKAQVHLNMYKNDIWN